MLRLNEETEGHSVPKVSKDCFQEKKMIYGLE